MSFDLNKIYDTIKTQISALPVVKAQMDALNVPTSSIEHFTLPPYPPAQNIISLKDQLNQRPDDPILTDLIKYNVDQREIYDVIDDFDQSPNNLSDNKKVLRKKYLNIILSVMDDRNNMMKSTLTQMANGPLFQGPMGGQQPDPRMKELFLLYGLGNYEPAFNTIKRIIKLLIMEIDLNGSTSCPVCASQTQTVCPTCKTCEVCPANNDNMYIGVIVGLIVLLVIISIIFAMSGGNHAPTPTPTPNF